MKSRIVREFFKFMVARRFADAERTLERLKKRLKKTVSDEEWRSGYLHALNGMLTALKSGEDSYSLIHNMNAEKKELKRYKAEMKRHAENTIHSRFDRGFFSAWVDYVDFLLKSGGAHQKGVE